MILFKLYFQCLKKKIILPLLIISAFIELDNNEFYITLILKRLILFKKIQWKSKVSFLMNKIP